MTRIVLVAAVGALACTSVHMVQRDGCWLKKTETTLGGSREELGFCAKPGGTPAEDRMSRLVQECMAQADYRWQNRAIAAWNRNEPIPPQDNDEAIAKACMNEATAALRIEAENAALKDRIAELSKDRDTLKTASDKDREFLQNSSDKMITALGEAAKKPAPNASATATSTTKTESDTTAQPVPPTTVVGFNGTAVPIAPRTVKVNACVPHKAPTTAKKADEPACEKKEQASLNPPDPARLHE
ncbi:MAG: hypothetical protein ABR567_11240 [Myxococcales bacterium]